MAFDFEDEFTDLLIGQQPVPELFEADFEIPDLELLPLPLPLDPGFEIPDLGLELLPLPLPLPMPLPDFEIPDFGFEPLPLPLPLPMPLPDFEIPDFGFEPLPLPLPLPMPLPDFVIPDFGFEPLPLPLPLPMPLPDFEIPDLGLEPLPLPLPLPMPLPDFEIPGEAPEDSGAEGTPVNRLYNSSQGRHLFSSNEDEIDILTESGWENEGALYLSPEVGTAEVFRFYVSTENRHFYTALEGERDMIIGNEETFAGWEFEGAAFSAYSTGDYPDEAVAVVRYLNQETGNHVYSTSTFEQSLLNEDSNWVNEGTAWYGDVLPVASDFI
jgi:hypothetical protein